MSLHTKLHGREEYGNTKSIIIIIHYYLLTRMCNFNKKNVQVYKFIKKLNFKMRLCIQIITANFESDLVDDQLKCFLRAI